MIGDENDFLSINSIIATKVRVGNGALIHAKGKGTISINIKGSNVSNKEEDEKEEEEDEEKDVTQGGEISDSDDEEPPRRETKILSDIYHRCNFTSVEQENYEEAIKYDV
ncbi:hypothetical protein KY289_016295 [Solanum tuberosum]|nr:hypothetical protein KY289_016295 [Solanum tuberosum]